MRALKNLMNSTVLVLSFSVVGVVAVALIFSYVFSVAGPVIEASIISLSYTIGYGLVALTVIAICCATAIMLSGSFEFVGNRIFGFQISRSRSKKELLQSQFEFRTLQQGEQGFMFSDLKNDSLVGRNISLEPGPFTSQSLPDRDPVALKMWAFLNAPAQSQQITNDVPLLEPQPAQLPLLPAIAHADNVLIVGGKGSGKTTLMQHIEAQRLNAGQQNIILDSHAMPSQWQGQMIGYERNYSMIQRAMIAIVDKLNLRYKKRSRGENLSSQNIFIDEFTLLPRKMKSLEYDIQDFSIPLLTEGRKVKLNAIWGIHSDKVGAMGLKGASDIKECFDTIIYLKNVKGERYAIVDFGEGKESIKYLHPGPFVIDQSTDDEPSILDLDVSEPEPDKPSNEEMRAIEAFVNVRDSGKFSWRKATQKAYGNGKFGDGPNKKMRSTLDKFEIDYQDYI